MVEVVFKVPALSEQLLVTPKKWMWYSEEDEVNQMYLSAELNQMRKYISMIKESDWYFSMEMETVIEIIVL